MLPMILRGLLGYCPRCGQGRMFDGLFALHTHCHHCGIQFENQRGDFTGAMHISATALAAFAMALGVLTMLIFKTSVWLTILIDVPIIVVVGLVLHRIIKALWMSFIVYTQALERADQEFWF